MLGIWIWIWILIQCKTVIRQGGATAQPQNHKQPYIQKKENITDKIIQIFGPAANHTYSQKF